MKPKTVKFEGMTVRVDRPKGFVQKGTDEKGRPWTRVYKYDYGYLPKTKGGDGEGIDVYMGPDEDAAEDAHWIIQVKDDGSFDEYKVFLGFKSREAALRAYYLHTPQKYYGGLISMSVQMMRAMLGHEPAEKLASIRFAAFLSELSAILGRVR